jgi:hypothetical protein
MDEIMRHGNVEQRTSLGIVTQAWIYIPLSLV